MIKLDVLNLLEKNGKTKYWLYKQLGMSYQNFSRMINNETKSIQYENIDALCQIFNCTDRLRWWEKKHKPQSKKSNERG